jgi:predicted nucleic acid-binding protein
VNYLLDTCVISELVAKRPNPQVIEWINRTEETHLYLSVITIGEIRKGIEKLAQSRRRTALEEWLRDQLVVRFGGRIVPVGLEVMLRWGELTGALESAGHPMSALDSLIAATTLQGNFKLVTRNQEDFKYTRVALFNPWK